MFTIVAPEVTGLEDLASKFSVYPVPATDEVTVKMELVRAADIVIVLTDLQGREVYRQGLGTTAQVAHSIPLVQEASGIWYLTVLLDGQPFTWPVIKR
ncbi:MAG TPA: hypothetical protein DCE41_26215 [Cytophagales bacterium]|nr:hypothetical protein [Cytophagales bacterium]